jgi:hypothetical protein
MTEALWPAPTASDPVDAVVTVPGSKSATNRALVLAALADDPGYVRRPLRSRDSLLMAPVPAGRRPSAGCRGCGHWGPASRTP